MRIHLQSKPGPHNFELTPEIWADAAARAGQVAAGCEPSFGNDRDAFAAGLRDAEILVAQTAALLDGLPDAPRLRLVFVTSAGLEKLLPLGWLPPGVKLLNNRGTHATKAGEYGLMALLMLVNQVPALMTAQREGRWAPLHGRALSGRSLVVVGLGALGGTAATHAKSFGMRVTGISRSGAAHPACDRVAAADALDEVLPEADFLYLATPLTPQTRGLLDRRRIALLPRGAGLANVGRGGLVDQDAVLDALDAGQLGGAVLDVFDPEPIPPGHRLWTTSNLVITPHVSADDPATYNARSLDILFDNLRAFREDRPLPNLFDPELGY